MSNKPIIILVLLVGIIYNTSADNTCGPNEIFDTCGTACPLTCKNPTPAPVCPLVCIIGCRCKDGFVKNDNDDCVLPKDC